LSKRKGILSQLVNYGDQSNIKSMMAASLIDYSTFSYVLMRTGLEIPVNIKFELQLKGVN